MYLLMVVKLKVVLHNQVQHQLDKYSYNILYFQQILLLDFYKSLYFFVYHITLKISLYILIVLHI